MNNAEITYYNSVIANCSQSAVKYVGWWCNNYSGGYMLISKRELHEAVEYATALCKRGIAINPYYNDLQKEMYKASAELFFRKDAEHLKQNLQEVLPGQYCLKISTIGH